MIRALTLLSILALAACAGGSTGNPSVGATSLAAANGGVCPDADPARDGPLVDAIRRDDATPVEALLAVNPDDARARAALILISGEGRANPDQAACFAPYLTTG